MDRTLEGQMLFRKIAGPMRVESNGATTLHYELTPRPGGRAAKVALYSLKIIQRSANVELGVELRMGPDGDVFGPAKVVIPPTAAPVDIPGLLTGATGTPDTNAADVLNEWLQAVVTCGVSSGTNNEWALVEVYELRKPF